MRTFLTGSSYGGAVGTRPFIYAAVSRRTPVGLTLTYIRSMGAPSVFTRHNTLAYYLARFSWKKEKWRVMIRLASHYDSVAQ